MRESISPSLCPVPPRYNLDDERKSITVGFTIYPPSDGESQVDPVVGKFVVGLFPDGTPGELFIHVDKQGSEIHGWADCWAISISLLLQFGVRPEKIYEKFKFQEFMPKGLTNVASSPFCKSIVDLIMQWMEKNLPPTAKVGEEGDSYAAAIDAATESS